jgi:hypothetical protein
MLCFAAVSLKCVFLCSNYDGQELLNVLAPTLCPDFFPPGQECTLPLYPGEYGSLVGGSLEIMYGELPDFLGKQIFTPYKENTVFKLTVC